MVFGKYEQILGKQGKIGGKRSWPYFTPINQYKGPFVEYTPRIMHFLPVNYKEMVRFWHNPGIF